MNKNDLMIELLEGLRDDELIDIYNNYSDINSYEKILINHIDDILEGYSPAEVFNAIADNYNINDNYCMYNGYGHLESFDGHQISEFISIDEIASYIIKNDDYLGNDEVAALLEEEEEEND